MWGDRSAMVAWSAGVSAAAAALAALFASGQALVDHVLFWTFAAVGIGAFVILLGAAARMPASPSRTDFVETARSRAARRAEQVRHIDQMPVSWRVTPETYKVMPVGFDGTGGSLAALERFSGNFRNAGSAFERMRPRRMVILGSPGAGKTTLVGKLFDDLLKETTLGVPLSVPAAQWGADGDVCAWVAAQFKVTRRRVSDALESHDILLMIEDLDELPPVLQAKAIDWINDLEPDTPLVVTSRSDEYMNAVQEHFPIRNAVVVELSPLAKSDAEIYLIGKTPTASADRWKKLSDLLGSEDDTPLAKVLTNPLMLWLAREIYAPKNSRPTELVDAKRFRSQDAIEDHLLDELIPRKFTAGGTEGVEPSHWARHAPQWLAFIAADLEKTRSPDMPWWRLALVAPGSWLVTFAVRGALLATAAWFAASWALRRTGGWRSLTDPRILLQGPLGHGIARIWSQLPSSVRHAENNAVRDVAHAVGLIPHPLLLVELCAVLIGASNGALHLLWENWRPGGATGYHLSRTRINGRGVLVFAIVTLGFTIAVTGSLVGAAMNIPEDERAKFFAAIFHPSAAGALVLAIFLWVCTEGVDPLIVERRDADELPNLSRALRETQWSTMLIVSIERASRCLLWWLIFGAVFAVAYAAYESMAISCKILLGGRTSASEAFADTRFWLACTRRMPWRILRFLTEAERLGILRQTGAAYQFRHARLRQQLSGHDVPLSQRITSAARPFYKLWRRHVRWPGGIGWRPNSVAPWTLSAWSVLMQELARDAAASGLIEDVRPQGPARRVGPGVVQRFGRSGRAAKWVLCSLPGQEPSIVAEPVWGALKNAENQALLRVGRVPGASPLTAIGFPTGRVVSADATRVALAGGSLGDGLLLGENKRQDWHWEPTRSYEAPWAGFVAVRSSPAKMLLVIESYMLWAVPRLQIIDQRYHALPSILTDSDLAQAALRLTPRSGEQLQWRELDNDRRNRGLLGFASSDEPPVVRMSLQLHKQLHATGLTTRVRLEISDVQAWLGIRSQHPDEDPRISLNELTGYLSASWRTAVDVLPSLVVDDPAAIPPVRRPEMGMSLSAYPDGKLSSGCDIRDIIDFSPYRMRASRQLTDMSLAISGPFYLGNEYRVSEIKRALAYLIQNSGYDPYSDNNPG